MTSDESSGRNRREDAAAGIGEPGAALSRKRVLMLLVTGTAGATTVLSGCASERPAVEEEGRDDVELLNDALELEHTGVAVYRSDPGPPGSMLRSLAQDFAEQAAERVRVLTALVDERGGAPLEPKTDVEYLEEVGLTDIEDEAGFIGVATELENAAVAGYTEAVAELSAPGLRRSLYALAGNSAAHISVLLGAAGEVQVPDALVTGQPA